jgi:hypothetical protein
MVYAVLIPAIHVPYGLGDVVAIVADGDLGGMASSALVDSIQLPRSL